MVITEQQSLPLGVTAAALTLGGFRAQILGIVRALRDGLRTDGNHRARSTSAAGAGVTHARGVTAGSTCRRPGGMCRLRLFCAGVRAGFYAPRGSWNDVEAGEENITDDGDDPEQHVPAGHHSQQWETRG